MIQVSPLLIEVISRKEFKVSKEITYDFGDKIITVYPGFIWDGATIPRGVWSIVGCPSEYLVESLLHDILYVAAIYDQKTSDKMFHKLLVARGVDLGTAKAMYLAVRVAGHTYFGKSSKSEGREYISVEFK